MKILIVTEGVENFKENRKLIRDGGVKWVGGNFPLIDIFGPKYHGPLSPGHLLVKKRREVQVREAADGTYHDHHYLDIYTCLKCGVEKECLRSGWEIGWWNGTESRKLK